MTCALPCPRPWLVAAFAGHSAEQCAGRTDWPAEWRQRIAAIGGANTSAAHRRAELERALAQNPDTFRATAAGGSIVAVLDVEAAIVAADCRLARLTGCDAAA